MPYGMQTLDLESLQNQGFERRKNDKNTIRLSRHGINQWLEILYFQVFDG